MTLKAMQKFAEKYCELTDTYFCSDLEIAATVVKGAWVGWGVR
jgi:ferredoxin-thioredoxin reductase catalytic subunit